MLWEYKGDILNIVDLYVSVIALLAKIIIKGRNCVKNIPVKYILLGQKEDTFVLHIYLKKKNFATKKGTKDR